MAPRTTSVLVAAAAVATLATLSACATGNTPSAAVNSAPMPTPVAPSPASPPPGPLSPRGNIVTHLGEKNWWTQPDGSIPVYFTFDQVQADPKCDQSVSTPAQNGHLVAIHVTVATQPSYPAAATWQLPSGSDFTTYDANNFADTGLSTGATYGCLEKTLNTGVATPRPASNYSGWVLIDTKNTHGILQYKPTGLEGSSFELTY